jgi:hypothetical protein
VEVRRAGNRYPPGARELILQTFGSSKSHTDFLRYWHCEGEVPDDEKGKTRRRTLCYLGREQDGTDTLANALAHWQHVGVEAKRELRKTKGERRPVNRRRIAATQARIGVITEQTQHPAWGETELRKREQQAEETVYWQAFDQLRRYPTEENARTAKQGFLVLATSPGPRRHASVKALKDAYDRVLAVWRRTAA